MLFHQTMSIMVLMRNRSDTFRLVNKLFEPRSKFFFIKEMHTTKVEITRYYAAFFINCLDGNAKDRCNFFDGKVSGSHTITPILPYTPLIYFCLKIPTTIKNRHFIFTSFKKYINKKIKTI